MMNIKTYTELSKLSSYVDRYRYLSSGITAIVGDETFGSKKYLYERFLHSIAWKQIRDSVIIRDNGCDMGLSDYPIEGSIFIHHMNVVTLDDLIASDFKLLVPEYLICVSFNTHNAIHYGDESKLLLDFQERTPNDTCPWRLNL